MSDLYIPDNILLGFGCRSCVWKSHNLCPHSISDGSVYSYSDSGKKVVGYCPELVSFLFSLSSPGDSLSAIKEKYLLYVHELQAMSDHSKFQELRLRYDKLKSDGASSDELSDLNMELNAYKMWWNRLSEQTVRGLGRIVDRESRSRDSLSSTKKITVQQLNVLLKEGDKLLEDKRS